MSINESTKKIDGVELREAKTKEEKLLLGFLHQEVERIKFGTIVVEFSVRNGAIIYIKSNEISRTFSIGQK